MPATGKSLTAKQEAFARLYVEIGSAAKAYREAYQSKGNDKTVQNQGWRILQLPVVKAFVEELRAGVRSEHGVTTAKLLEELEEARQVGKKTGNASAMVAATLAKAKLSGLDKGGGDDGDVPQPVEIRVSVVDARKPSA